MADDYGSDGVISQTHDTMHKVFLVLLEQFTVIESSCAYTHIRGKYKGICEKKEYLDDIFTNIDVIDEFNSNVFLEKVVFACSNYDEYFKCVKCSAKHVCAEEQDRFHEVLAERWSVFCDGDQPASWLATILQNEVNYTSSCYFKFMDTLYSCLPKSSPKDDSPTFSELADLDRNITQDVFSCSLTGILKNGNEDCGSSWRDVLMIKWLDISSRWGLSYYIDKEEITQLQMMRC
ncbi:uncharacterized protein LOC132752564 [Ruditapes philippinarum]|uniref:uncharacterized protein LOC132752564 n=1 Tax=Ruditapes philippinarum TaxID=129788 RepID=UPI00295BF88E|nr:uncharacterized protein LOC132752564 [Ruditapes philippinarum]